VSVFPTRILLATDGSPDAGLANSTAADLANSTNSELHVVTVVRTPDPAYITDMNLGADYGKMMETIRREGRETLEAEIEKVRAAGGKVEQGHVRVGESREQEIVGLSEELGAGLIVMGSRGLGGMRRALMGSVSDAVVRNAHCPVMVVRQ